MIPCHSDDEVNETWIYTSAKQLKHENSGLCIGR